MNDEVRLRRIGQCKVKEFQKDFDGVYDYWREKANSLGHFGDLKFIKERGKVIIYTEIILPEPLERDETE